jgi:ABC-type sugar transport system permease subunit
MEQTNMVIQEKKTLKKRQKDMIFVACLVVLPLIQYSIFYVYVNINSIALAFQSYVDGQYVWNNFANFERLMSEFVNSGILGYSLINSFTYYVIHTLVGTAGSLFFSYYIFKKRFASKFFKIALFLPSIIASMALVLSYKYFLDYALPGMLKSIGIVTNVKLASDIATKFGAVVVYGCMMGFGTSLLMYSGAMSNISDSVMEAAEIDGAGELRQFFNVALPLIYPTITTFLINGVATIFSSDMNLYAFYGGGAEKQVYTFGYYLLKLSREANMDGYPYPAAIGIILTVITVPLTLFVRWALQKFGPKTI